MKNYLKHIDDFFREKLGRYRETPPPDVWEALDKQLDGLVPSAPRPSFRWAGHIVMVSLVAVLSIPVVKKILGHSRHADKATITEIAAVTKTQANIQAANGVTPERAPKEATSEAAQNMPSPVASASVNNTNEAATTGRSANDDAGNAKAGTGGKNLTIKDKGIVQAKSDAGSSTIKEKKQPGWHKPNTVAKTKGNTKSEKTLLPNSKKDAKHATQPTEEINNYAANPGNELVTTAKAEKTATDNQPKPTTKTDKKESVKTKTILKAETMQPVKSLFNMVELGLKAGYERGTTNDAAAKYVVSPYLQYNLSPKVALMVQPAVKYAQLSTKNIGTIQPYYNVIEGGQTKQNGNSTPNMGVVGGTIDTISYTTKYTYSTTYDSIAKSYTTGGRYLELELPVLLKYNISKKLSVYGGANFTYNKLTGIKENTYTKHDITRSVDFEETTPVLPTVTPAGPGINYTGSPISDYKSPLYRVSTAGRLNVGYMLGFSYEFTHRWLFDALMQQSVAGSNEVGGYDVNVPVSAVYFRLSAGYKFIK